MPVTELEESMMRQNILGHPNPCPRALKYRLIGMLDQGYSLKMISWMRTVITLLELRKGPDGSNQEPFLVKLQEDLEKIESDEHNIRRNLPKIKNLRILRLLETSAEEGKYSSEMCSLIRNRISEIE